MLLLPLLIWWAHKPMHFSGNLLGSINSLLTFAAVVIPLWGDRSVHAADRMGAVQNELRELRSEQHLINTPVGDSDIRLRGKRFREGTLVPSTTGRFAPSGRRWVFIPDDATDSKDTVADTRQTQTPAKTLVAIPVNPLRILSPPISSPPISSATGINGLRAAEIHLPSGNSLAASQWVSHPHHLVSHPHHQWRDEMPQPPTTPPFRLAANAQSSGSPNETANPIGIPQLIAVENLMLQRIVEAIRVDGSDNRWTITAQITEFFGENRLQILTAERAPAQ